MGLSGHKHHAVLECVPISPKAMATAPGYFKKAMQVGVCVCVAIAVCVCVCVCHVCRVCLSSTVACFCSRLVVLCDDDGLYADVDVCAMCVRACLCLQEAESEWSTHAAKAAIPITAKKVSCETHPLSSNPCLCVFG